MTSRASPQDAIWIGEGGMRMALPPYWCVYPEVQSQLWDLYEIRHVIAPTVTAVKYVASDAVADQRDTVDLGLAQRWQTKRGPALNRRTVDWIEWNSDFVWVSNPDTASAGPDRLPWGTPFIPLTDRYARVLPPIDRRSTTLWGPRQNYASTDAIMRLTDTTSILAGGYFGMQTDTVEQADIGFTHVCWPDLSYYVGTRYLRRYFVGTEERTSNALTVVITVHPGPPVHADALQSI